MYIYRLRSLSKPSEIYIGMTENLTVRLAGHNSGQSPHTAKFKPWFYEAVIWLPSKRKAIKFESYLKSHSGRAFAAKHF
ncbi:GIY-YIG nuclease family protein [bacterium]|nr:GIY-YIG nuclease family protein [bacterium]